LIYKQNHGKNTATMKKLILALTLVAALAAPAYACDTCDAHKKGTAGAKTECKKTCDKSKAACDKAKAEGKCDKSKAACSKDKAKCPATKDAEKKI
jgi:hypothetical protein